MSTRMEENDPQFSLRPTFPQHDDSAEREAILEAHNAYLHRLAASFLKGRRSAKFSISDLIQDTFASAWRRQSEGAGPEPVLTRIWLGAILRNKVRNAVRFWRRDKRNAERDLPIGSIGRDLPAIGGLLDPAAFVAEDDAFAWAMAALPEEQRVVIELFLVHDMTMRESAEAIGISEDCARKRYERGLAFLKPLLERESGATANQPRQ